MTKNNYFTIDGAYDFKMIRAFNVHPKTVKGNFDMTSFVIDFMVAERQGLVQTAAKLAESQELWLAKMLFAKANQISDLIDFILEGRGNAKEVTLQVADFIFSKRVQ